MLGRVMSTGMPRSEQYLATPVIPLWARVKAKLRFLLGSLIRFVLNLTFKAHRIEPSTLAQFQPKRILLLNGAHIGDAVISTSLFPVLRSAYPNAELGFATGTWSSMALKDHPDLKWIHCLDHWRLNRSNAGHFSKLKRYWKTRRTALQEIRAVGYDLGLSVYPSYPDFLDLAWLAKIPVRIGFSHSMFARLATTLVDFSQNPFLLQGARQLDLLCPLGIDASHYEKRKTSLPPSDEAAVKEVCSLLQIDNIRNARYRIIHMGSGALTRELPLTFWREIATQLSPHNKLIFTGQGERECANISSVIQGLPNCLNACNRLSWKGFVAAVRDAEMLYGVESMAGHVASAVGTKCSVVYSGAAGVARWRPEGDLVTVYTNHVSCAPCEFPCEPRPCLHKISPSDLLQDR